MISKLSEWLLLPTKLKVTTDGFFAPEYQTTTRPEPCEREKFNSTVDRSRRSRGKRERLLCV